MKQKDKKQRIIFKLNKYTIKVFFFFSISPKKGGFKLVGKQLEKFSISVVIWQKEKNK